MACVFVLELPLSIFLTLTQSLTFSELWFLDLKMAWSQDQEKNDTYPPSLVSIYDLMQLFPSILKTDKLGFFIDFLPFSLPRLTFSHPPPQAQPNESSVNNQSQEKEVEKYLDN